LNLKREIAISLVVAIWFPISAIHHVPPLSYMLELNAYVKNSWVGSKDLEPAFGRGELPDLATFCRRVEIPVDEASRGLAAKRVKLKSLQGSLADIAQYNGPNPLVTPEFPRELSMVPRRGRRSWHLTEGPTPRYGNEP
jgi:hypothetical protein